MGDEYLDDLGHMYTEATIDTHSETDESVGVMSIGYGSTEVSDLDLPEIEMTNVPTEELEMSTTFDLLSTVLDAQIHSSSPDVNLSTEYHITTNDYVPIVDDMVTTDDVIPQTVSVESTTFTREEELK